MLTYFVVEKYLNEVGAKWTKEVGISWVGNMLNHYHHCFFA